MNSLQSATETTNVGRLTVISHRGHSADALCFKARALCFARGPQNGTSVPNA